MFVTGTDSIQKELNEILVARIRRAGHDVVVYPTNDWWDKPQVLLDATARHGKCVWIDNDIEIVDDRFFDVLDMPANSAAVDAPADKRGWARWNAGVVVLDRDFAQRWCDQLDRAKRGDQDSMPVPNHEIPRRYNELVTNVDFDPMGAYAIHWTGYYKWEYLKHVRDRDGRLPEGIKRAADETARRIRRDHLSGFELVGQTRDLARRMYPLWEVRVDRQ